MKITEDSLFECVKDAYFTLEGKETGNIKSIKEWREWAEFAAELYSEHDDLYSLDELLNHIENDNPYKFYKLLNEYFGITTTKPGEAEGKLIDSFSDAFLNKCKHELDVRKLESQLGDVLNYDKKTLRDIAESRISNIEVNTEIMHWDNYDEEELIEIADEYIDLQKNQNNTGKKALENFIKERNKSVIYSFDEISVYLEKFGLYVEDSALRGGNKDLNDFISWPEYICDYRDATKEEVYRDLINAYREVKNSKQWIEEAIYQDISPKQAVKEQKLFEELLYKAITNFDEKFDKCMHEFHAKEKSEQVKEENPNVDIGKGRKRVESQRPGGMVFDDSKNKEIESKSKQKS